MDEILRFTSLPSVERISQDAVQVGQYHVISTDDGAYLAQRIFEVDRSGANLSIRMGVPESSHRREFSVGQKVEILRKTAANTDPVH
jgi:hypothetical protein